MSNKLIVIGRDQSVNLYQRMQAAISKCYTLDDCREISKQAEAIAAYYKQIKDDESLRRFLNIKMRAWRRIGEIVGTVDNSGCETMAAHIRKIKKMLNIDLADDHVRQALKISSIPTDFFEQNIEKHHSIASIVSAYEADKHKRWLATPEGKAALKREALRRKEYEEQEAKREANRPAREARAQERIQSWMDRMTSEMISALSEAQQEIKYGGRERQALKHIMLFITNSMHDVLSKAASEQNLSKQAILRAGLAMWLNAHGYRIDEVQPCNQEDGAHD